MSLRILLFTVLDMDSHGSESPMRAPALVPGTGATTSRPAAADVTRWRPAVEIPGFRDVEQQPDGSWTAVRRATREVIAAPTFERLEMIEAPIVRIAFDLRRTA